MEVIPIDGQAVIGMKAIPISPRPLAVRFACVKSGGNDPRMIGEWMGIKGL
ncbi:hypothetical protein [Sphingomonas abietis]|uniref:Uncharacterized protein n=1 Tax=Sphingomonas abietis TaxID=3012344 RepID=A0ABY7NNJ3_9SPHN|nr:hypothetical protein [Sphingomonas abietis]WBO22147.1 hypothetical protein PBT88_18660 [Sphingomonas abietis]